MRLRSTLALMTLVAAGTIFAAPGVRRAPAQSLPEVHDDRTVTLRIFAPNAETVTVVGDIGDPFPLTKGDEGEWSVTTPSLKPDLYRYAFEIDGQPVLDTANTEIWSGATFATSAFFVPGAESDFMAHRDVPHGALHEHWYQSSAIGAQRRVIVYTPPGYDARDEKEYPVLYLMHGRSADETYWPRVGRANFILDNLLAENNAEPMLIVMPFGHSTREAGATSGIRRGDVSQGRSAGRGARAGGARAGGGRAGGDRGGRGAARGQATRRGGRGGGGRVFELDAIEADLLDDVIPLVQAQYRVRTDSAGRAIAGLSMGGYQALAIGLNHVDHFDYVGAFSSALIGDFTTVVPGFLADVAASNAALKLLWLGCGDQDTLLNANRTFEQALTAAGVEHQWEETPGYAHVSAIWRIYLHSFLPKLFREAPAEAGADARRRAAEQIGLTSRQMDYFPIDIES
jgi:enterochelin esterase family protein